MRISLPLLLGTCLLWTVALLSAEAGDNEETRASERTFYIRKGKPEALMGIADVQSDGGALVLSGRKNPLFADRPLGYGDFRVHAELKLPELDGSGRQVLLEGNYHTTRAKPSGDRRMIRFILDGSENYLRAESGNSHMFRIHKGEQELGRVSDHIKPGEWFTLEMRRQGRQFTLSIDGSTILEKKADTDFPASVGFHPGTGSIHIRSFWASGPLIEPAEGIELTDVWKLGDGGAFRIRIPVIVRTPGGDLLAFAESTPLNAESLPGASVGPKIIVMKRSEDGGKTWSDQEVLWNNTPATVHNPVPIVDDNGTIHLLVVSNPPLDGTEEAGPGRPFYLKSTDDGRSWSEPRDLFGTGIQEEHWSKHNIGPCSGIQLTRGEHKGRLIVPATHIGSFPSRIKKRRQQLKKQGRYMRAFRQYGHVLYSDDHGNTWHRSESWEPGTTENTVVELADGAVMGNGRFIMSDMHGNRFGHRAVTISRNGGERFGPLLMDHELPEPACQGQLLRYSWPKNKELGGRSRILFSNPGVMPRGMEYRIRMTVRLSYDEGRTWPVAREIYPGFSAYSGLVRLPDGKIGVIFERDGYRRISFARFPLDWLTAGSK